MLNAKFKMNESLPTFSDAHQIRVFRSTSLQYAYLNHNSSFCISHSEPRFHHSAFKILHSPFGTSLSSFRIPHSAFRIPNPAFIILHSKFCILHSVLHFHHSAFCIPNSAFRSPHSVLRILHSTFPIPPRFGLRCSPYRGQQAYKLVYIARMAFKYAVADQIHPMQ